MRKNIKSSLGRSFILVVCGSLVLTAVLLSFLSAQALHRLGVFSVRVSAEEVESQARGYLFGLVRERAKRHEKSFQNAVAFTQAVAERGAYYLNHIDLYGQEGAWGEEKFTYRPDKGIHTNQREALVSSVYWDKETIGPQARARINATSHLDQFLASAMRNSSGAVACWLMLKDTVVRYYPNTHLVDHMPPKWEFDYRQDHCFQLGTPENNPSRSAVWSDVYQDTVGQGLVVTVAAPFYTDSGEFQGVTGIDFSLDSIVHDVLERNDEGVKHQLMHGEFLRTLPGSFSLLLDRNGNVIALPLDKVGFLGIAKKANKEIKPGDVLNYRLGDSSEVAIRDLAQRMVKGEKGVVGLGIGGQEHLAAYSPLSATGWSLAVIVPQSAVLSSVRSIQRAVDDERDAILINFPFAAAGVTLFSLILALIFITRRVFRPIRDLLVATRAISLGDLDHVVEVPHDDEFGDLGQAFNTMTRDLRRHEKLLREAEEQYRSIFEGAVEGIYQSTPQGIFLNANRAMARMLGYDSPQDLMQAVRDIPAQIYVDPDDRKSLLERLEAEGEVVQFETRLRRKDGGIIWARLGGRAVYGPDGTMESVNGLLEDYTDAQKAREEIHRLSQELMRAQERERSRIARDLHDGVAQTLSSLKIAAGVLFDGYPEAPAELRQRAVELSGRLQECIAAVRGMAYDLHPASLDELGLVRTLEQYCREFSERTGILVEFMAAGMEGVVLAPETQINLYRLTQEALHNVEKHSGAGQARVRLVASHPRVILRVSDSGQGFDMDKLSQDGTRRRMGLRSMEERARLMGGWLDVAAQPGKGVRIKVEIPSGSRPRN